MIIVAKIIHDIDILRYADIYRDLGKKSYQSNSFLLFFIYFLPNKHNTAKHKAHAFLLPAFSIYGRFL